MNGRHTMIAPLRENGKVGVDGELRVIGAAVGRDGSGCTRQCLRIRIATPVSITGGARVPGSTGVPGSAGISGSAGVRGLART